MKQMSNSYPVYGSIIVHIETFVKNICVDYETQNRAEPSNLHQQANTKFSFVEYEANQSEERTGIDANVQKLGGNKLIKSNGQNIMLDIASLRVYNTHMSRIEREEPS